MNKQLLLLILLNIVSFIPSIAVTADKAAKKIDLSPSPSSDFLNNPKLDPNVAPASKTKIKFTVGCTDSTGNSLKPTDPGYTHCVNAAQSKSGSPAGKEAKQTATATINIK